MATTNNKKENSRKESEAESNNNKDELLAQFCSITGADSKMGENMLEACSYDLNLAVEMHMDSGGPSTSASASHSNGRNAVIDDGGESSGVEVIDEIRAPIKPVRETLVQDQHPSWAPLRRRAHNMPRSVFNPQNRNFAEEIREQENIARQTRNGPITSMFPPPAPPPPSSSSSPPLMSSVSPTPSASSSASVLPSTSYPHKVRKLADLYRPPFEIMFRGTLDLAKEEAKKQGKWLLVDLHNAQEFCCQVLNRDIWNDEEMRKLIKKYFIFWQITTDSVDGEKYQMFYKAFGFPHISVLNPRTGECVAKWQEADKKSLIRLITQFLSENLDINQAQPFPSTSSASSSASSQAKDVIDISETEQLEAAIAASLADLTTKERKHKDGDRNHYHYTQDVSDDDTDGDEVIVSSPGISDDDGVQKHTRKKKSVANKNLVNGGTMVGNPAVKRKRTHITSGGSSGGSLGEGSGHEMETVDVNDAVSRLSVSDEDDITETPPKKKVKAVESEAGTFGSSWAGGISDTGKEMQLLIRHPDGSRDEITVTTTTKLQVIVNYMVSHGHSADEYELVQHFPHKSLSDFHQTLSDCGICNRDTIFIQAR